MPVTNFPGPGDDRPVSLANSNWDLFPVGEAQELKDEWPGIWKAGGNIRGNSQFAILAPMARERRGPRTPAEERAIRLREAWVARHRQDFRLPGVVAQIKWLAVSERGIEHMRDVIQEAKDKMERRHVVASLAEAQAAPLVTKDGEEEGGIAGPSVFSFVITNGQVDRQRERVDPNGWDFSQFERNPVILDGHASGSIADIVGRGLPPIRRVGDDWILDVVTADTDRGRLARKLILEGSLRTVSVGFVSRQRERDADGILVHTKAELLEVSLVPIPANPGAVLVAAKAAIPAQEFPVDLEAAWDGDAAEQAVRVWASSDGSGAVETIDWDRYRQAFMWVDEANPELLGSYKLGIATVQDGELVIVAAGVAAAAAALGGARGGVDIPDGDRPAVLAALEAYRGQIQDAKEEASGDLDEEAASRQDDDMEMKAGRVISRANEDAIRAAREHAMALIESLDQILSLVPGDAPAVEPGPYPPEAEEESVPRERMLRSQLAAVLRAVMEE